jgi:endogenous inhibitor of DNA gyrase (YacG/DUF329 family)
MSKCPTCGKASAEKYTPFCCKRCADVDLGRWLNEAYVVPTEEKVEENEEENSE